MLRAGERQPRAGPWLSCAPSLEHGAGLGQGRVWDMGVQDMEQGGMESSCAPNS